MVPGGLARLWVGPRHGRPRSQKRRYSKVEESKRVQWNEFTREYFLARGTLANVLILIDASIPPLPLDIACVDWLIESEVPFTIVFTKTDKHKAGRPERNMEKFRDILAESYTDLPVCFATSARLNAGSDPLLK